MHAVTFTHVGKSIDLLKHKSIYVDSNLRATMACTLSLSHTWGEERSNEEIE